MSEQADILILASKARPDELAAVGNRSMEVCDPEIREAMRSITFRSIGEGEAI
ncbi:MAG: hypothetical protein QF473_21020 [Planctomycetota bacterium]|jgi:hypothetical protein|nr:hypothetical protein [Planctomycetota bacterium]MDP6505169.1 hypothetical protein [Planctomycetota bacterium]